MGVLTPLLDQIIWTNNGFPTNNLKFLRGTLRLFAFNGTIAVNFISFPFDLFNQKYSY
jgi:hypothetical protein